MSQAVSIGSSALSGAATGAVLGSAVPVIGTAVGAVVGGLVGVAGSLLSKQKAPQAAPAPNVNVGQVQQQTILNNEGALESAENLSAQTNQFDEAQAIKDLNTAMPGYSAAQSSLMSLFNQQASNAQTGQLSASTQSMIAQYAAEQGVSRGTSGGFNSFDVTKDFGINQEQYQQQQAQAAMGTLSSVYGMTPQVSPMSPSSMFVTPNTALGVQQYNATGQYNASQGAFNSIAAASNMNSSLLGGAVQNMGNQITASALQQQKNQQQNGGTTNIYTGQQPGSGSVAANGSAVSGGGTSALALNSSGGISQGDAEIDDLGG